MTLNIFKAKLSIPAQPIVNASKTKYILIETVVLLGLYKPYLFKFIQNISIPTAVKKILNTL